MKISFTNKNSTFATTLKHRVDHYFKSNKISPTGNKILYTKTAILLTVAVTLYSVLLLTSPPLWLSITLAALFGLNLALIGFNVMHDAAHGSYSKKPWVNTMMSYTLNVMGGISFLWKQKHNVNHHSFTNITGHDDDIDIRPLMRTNEQQPRKSFHRFQHIYGPFLYGFSYWSFVFGKNFTEYFRGRIGDVKLKKFDVKEHVIFWTSKITYLFIFIAMPILVLGVAKALTGFAIMSFFCGLLMAIIFQLAHIIEGASFPMPDTETAKIESDWITHQIETTANFSTRNKFLSWALGGLNFQVEHHLFPRISHVHYPELSKRVKATCEEFGVRYMEYQTVFKAVGSHLRHLKVMGRVG